MKTKGFTLIELLAVIVILAIIALIAVPIILNIIGKSKEEGNKRSIDMYAKAVQNAVAAYSMKFPNEEITFEKIEEYIEYSGSTVECKTSEINNDGTIYLDECYVNNELVKYTYGTKKDNTQDDNTKDDDTQETESILKAVTDTTKTTGNVPSGNYDAGDEYIFEVGGTSYHFFVLKDNGNTVTLLMDRNYTDSTVPAKMKWCIDGGTTSACKNITSKEEGTYLSHIQEVFGESVGVGIPSYEQLEGIECTGSSYSCPTWAYDYLGGTTHPVSGLDGYWTSSVVSGSSRLAWNVYRSGALNLNGPVDDVELNSYGLRPTITVSKSDIS